jgi:di/tricarboxylate transporter
MVDLDSSDVIKGPIEAQKEKMPLQGEMHASVRDRTDPHFVRLSKGFLLCVAFSANVGGVATLTGTPPNLILKGFVDEYVFHHTRLCLPFLVLSSEFGRTTI